MFIPKIEANTVFEFFHLQEIIVLPGHVFVEVENGRVVWIISFAL